MINISGLTKTYGRATKAFAALRGLDLEVPGGLFGLLGPNGAGKSSLMRILAGIAHASGGSVRVYGHDLLTTTGRLAAKHLLGYLPQELGMYGELTASQFVDYMAILKGVGEPRERARRVANCLERVALDGAAHRKIQGFSGGMKRRVGIAQALVNDPKLLIVDEPTAGLDPEERIRFRNLLVELAADRTVILSTHIVEDIGQTCRDLALLAAGQLLFRGSPAALAAEANGRVWTLTGPRLKEPPSGMTLVSMLHLEGGAQYRLVGEPAAGLPLEPTKPSLEDGYVWRMKQVNPA